MIGDPVTFLIWSIYLIPAAVIAIPGHELGHAVGAYFLGDRSVRYWGYLKPQLRRYIDPYGLVAVFLANVGWGRPAPVQDSKIGYRGGRRVLYKLAGPLANLFLAFVFGVSLRSLVLAGIRPAPVSSQPLMLLCFAVFAIYFLNLAIFAFQLLPIPGLDGWEILAALLRRRWPGFFARAEMSRQTIWIICLAAVFFGPLLLHFSVLGAVVGIFFEPASLVILGQCVNYVSLQPCPL
ncbi:MAG TPA: site-2 protease family protein [Candidatus Dormibacteraeota bacterium]